MDTMKKPRKVKVDPACAEAPLASLITAAKAGRLVALLRDEGLTGSAIQELLRPESAAKLRAVLNESVFSARDGRTASPESQPARLQPRAGKVLVFKARETFRR
jgi:hypothetical protein